MNLIILIDDLNAESLKQNFFEVFVHYFWMIFVDEVHLLSELKIKINHFAVVKFAGWIKDVSVRNVFSKIMGAIDFRKSGIA